MARRGEGKTKLKFADAEYFDLMIRSIQVLPEFDRIMLSAIVDKDYGNASRVLSMLHNEGYIEEVGRKRKYSVAEVSQNPEFTKRWWHYGTGGDVRGATVYRKTDRWPECVQRYAAFKRAYPRNK